MKLEDLTAAEKLALGGLVRVMIRADGSFSEEEERRLDQIGEEIGSAEALWKAISESAQAFRNDQEIRNAAVGVSRPEAQGLILDVLTSVAAADTITPTEMTLIDALRASWSAASTVP